MHPAIERIKQAIGLWGEWQTILSILGFLVPGAWAAKVTGWQGPYPWFASALAGAIGLAVTRVVIHGAEKWLLYRDPPILVVRAYGGRDACLHVTNAGRPTTLNGVGQLVENGTHFQTHHPFDLWAMHTRLDRGRSITIPLFDWDHARDVLRLRAHGRTNGTIETWGEPKEAHRHSGGHLPIGTLRLRVVLKGTPTLGEAFSRDYVVSIKPQQKPVEFSIEELRP